MSSDPSSGIAYVEMYQNSDGTETNGVQFSGVLIAPDEILTVAHGVTDPDGTFRSMGAAYLDYNGGLLFDGDPIANVHVLDNSHPSGASESDSQIASDLAVVHLKRPVSGAQVFSLGIAQAGSTYQITGYPAVDNGQPVSITEALSQGAVTGEFSGPSLTGTADASGASGGPVFTTDDGTPTVVGLVTAENGQGGMITSGLTGADIAQIDAWVYSDDASSAWGSAFSPTSAAAAESASATARFSTPPVESAPTDELDQLATMLNNAAADGGQFSTVMSSVATALIETRRQGGSGSDIPDAAFQAASDLKHGLSDTPGRAVAYLGGMLAAASGIGEANALDYINNVFGLDVSSSKRRAVHMGFAVESNIGDDTTSASISPPAAELASTLRNAAATDTSWSHAASPESVFSPVMVDHRTTAHFA